MNEVQRGKETLEQAVSRLVKQVMSGDEDVRIDLEAALLQMAAWAYEDAAIFFCPDCAINHPVSTDRWGNIVHEHRGVMELDDGLEHDMYDFNICKAEALHHRAAAIRKGE